MRSTPGYWRIFSYITYAKAAPWNEALEACEGVRVSMMKRGREANLAHSCGHSSWLVWWPGLAGQHHCLHSGVAH